MLSSQLLCRPLRTITPRRLHERPRLCDSRLMPLLPVPIGQLLTMQLLLSLLNTMKAVMLALLVLQRLRLGQLPWPPDLHQLRLHTVQLQQLLS